MRRLNVMGCCCAVLLTASLVWTTGCGGSDGDDSGGTTTVVVTNSTGGTTTVEVPNAPAAEVAEADAADAAVAGLVAPQLVKPRQGEELVAHWEVVQGQVFQWKEVPGASSYVLEVNGQAYQVNDTSKVLNLAEGTFQWRVSAAGGPFSAWREFTVVADLLVPEPI